MKKLLLMLSTALMLTFTGCMQFDDTRIWDAIDELEDLYDDLDGRLEKLEEECEKMNTNIEALQTLVSALQSQDTITTIAPIKQGDEIIGYTISFSKSEPITIYHGEDGKDGADGEDGKDGANGSDGYTPTIGVAKDADENYYWTLDGEWLLDAEGNKIKANGNDGKDGADGEDGEDGITPKLEIRDGYWYISYDNGQSWVELGKATGEDGKDGANGADGADGEDGKDGENGKDGADGDSLFQSVTWDEEYAYFTLSDGTVITIPLSDGAVTKTVEVNAVEMIGLCADNLCMFVLTDSGFNHEAEYWGDAGWMSFNSEYYVVGLVLETIDDSSVVPQGTFTSESGEIDIRDGSYYEYLGDDWDDWYDYNFDNAVVIVSEDKIEATFTLENGEVHHVIYEGSLELYFKGITDKEEDNEEGDLPPANEIWYTSTDGEVVTPSYADEFGVNIISNTYENGVGIITFDGDVTSIGEKAFRNCESLTNITIPEGITEIGEDAFLYCESLVSINIPNSVTSIGKYAFAGCLSLASINIPDSVTSIGIFAFADCGSLVEFKGKFASEDGRCIVVDGELKAFASAGLTEYIIPEGVTSIGKSVFAYKRLASVTIPNSVTSIGKYAFEGCLDLLSITIPEGVTYIGDAAFYDCESLAEVYCKATTPPSLGVDAFYNNASECKIYVPTESVDAYKAADYWSEYANYIEPYNFGGGEELVVTENMKIYYTSTDGEVVTPAYEYAFGVNILSNTYENGVGIITFDGDVTEIGEYAFCACSSLASVTIPNSVTYIGFYAFEDCYSLTSINIPDGVTSIGGSAFRDCSSLASINIPDGVTYIGESAFYCCESLTSVTIPDSVTYIGQSAFYNCWNLASVTIPDSVTEIGYCAFARCYSLASVTITDSVTLIGGSAFSYCTSLASVYCKATTPPPLSADAFNNNASERKIYVPTESVEAYQTAPNWSDYAGYIEPYNFGGGEGNAGVKEVAAVSLGGMWDMWQEEAIIPICGFISDKPFNGDFLSIDSWSYGFTIISDTEPINDEIPLGTYTYVDYEKIVNGEEELKAGTFVMDQLIDDDITTQCFYTNANGETQGFNYTEGVMVVSEGKIELTVTLENGEVHHVVYEGSLQTWGEAA